MFASGGVGVKSRKSGLRTFDVARQAGYSVQQVRNLERDGVLPFAARTRAGYRVYTEAHDSMTISELAGALGVRPSTLRHWDAEGLVVPDRTSTRARTYSPSDVRDARIVHQLRMAGYRIGTLQALMPQLRRARRWEEVISTLAARDASITARSQALLQGAAALNTVINAGTRRLDPIRGTSSGADEAAGLVSSGID